MADAKENFRRHVKKNLSQIAKRDFFIFLLEDWKISSGEHQGEPFSFKDRPYMVEIARDTFNEKITMKSAQCGVSEMFVAEAIHDAGYGERNALYTMPAGEQMQQFVDSRARQAILVNPKLAMLVSGTLNLKKFSLSNKQIYFRGVQKRRQIISVDVSSLYADEIDEYEEEATINTLTKRLGASANPKKRYFSTPSFHGTGISLFYYGSDDGKERGSDQRVWTIRCEHCGKYNEDLIWGENTIDLNDSLSKYSSYQPNVVVVCRKCKKQIDRLANGMWVAKFPSLSNVRHGYHISKLFSPTGNLNQILIDLQSPLKEQETYNSDLGLPYEPKGSRLTDSAIDAARGSHLLVRQTHLETFAGIDIGNKIHAIAGLYDENQRIKVIGAQELDGWEDMPYFFSDYNVKSAVIDMNPDKKEAMEFQEEREGVKLGYFAQHLENTKDQFTVGDDESVIAINRTLMMMFVSDLIYNKRIVLPIDIATVRSFYEHLKSPVKAQKENIHGEMVTFYPKTKGADHYYFSLLYLLVASMFKSLPTRFRIIRTI